MAEPKDKWDKFDIVSKFAVSVAIALIAGLYTCSQNNLEKQRQAKSTEVETLSKFMPYLSGTDEPAKKAALLAMRRISSTEFMTEIAQLYPSAGAVDALQAVVDLPSATTNERRLASAALTALRSIPASDIAAFVATQPCKRAVIEVILHHSETSISQYKGLPTMRAIQDQQVNQLGWSDMGTHYAVAPDGNVWICRPLNADPTSVVNHNKDTVSVTLLCDGNKELPTAAQARACGVLLKALLSRFGIDAKDNFSPHRGFHKDYTLTDCPGAKITKEDVLRWIAEPNGA